MKIEVGKFYKTRRGSKVRIYTIENGGEYPIHGAVFNGTWESYSWNRDGEWVDNLTPAGDDIVAEWVEEEERTYWINVYDFQSEDVMHRSKKSADDSALFSSRLACVPVTIKFKKGDGL